MAVTRGIDIKTKEITLKGGGSIYELLAQLIDLGIVGSLDLKQQAGNFACLIRLRDAQVLNQPLLVRFVGNYFSDDKQAIDFAQFFYYLVELGIHIEIVDSQLVDAKPVLFADYFFQPIASKIKLISYSVDLDRRVVSLFTDMIGIRSLHKWAGELNVVYSLETLDQFLVMLEAINEHYVPVISAKQPSFSMISSDRDVKELDDGTTIIFRMADQLPQIYAESLSVRAEFLLGLRAVCNAYLKLGRNNHELIGECYENVVQMQESQLNDVLMTLFMRLETLLPVHALPFFTLPIYARIERLNDTLDKYHAARMLCLLMQACGECVDDAGRKMALSNVHYPTDMSGKLKAAYDGIRQPLARLKSVMQAYHLHLHEEDQVLCRCKPE